MEISNLKSFNPEVGAISEVVVLPCMLTYPTTIPGVVDVSPVIYSDADRQTLSTQAPFTHSRFLATVPLRFATICKIVVYRGVLWSFVVEPESESE